MDAYEQWLSKEAREESWLRSRPVCAHCGHPIQEETLFVIEGEPWHEECAISEFRKYTEDFIE